MASFVSMDSIYRDRDQFPNENTYELFPSQVELWYKQPRTSSATARNPGTRPQEFCVTMSLHTLVIPYSAAVAGFPIVYVNFQSTKYRDVHLINVPFGEHSDDKFVCEFDKIQYDSEGAPMWIHYKCTMRQVLRYENGQPVIFRITSRSGDVLPQQDTTQPVAPDANKQTLAVIEILPFEIDGSFSETKHSQPLVG